MDVAETQNDFPRELACRPSFWILFCCFDLFFFSDDDGNPGWGITVVRSVGIVMVTMQMRNILFLLPLDFRSDSA